MSGQDQPPSWWSADDLRYLGGRLVFDDRALEEIARRGTPVFVTRPARAAENLARLRSAAPETAVYYAVKANRHPIIIETLRRSGIDGIDVCSPSEARLALSAGFSPEQISYTGTSVSNADLDFLTSEPGIPVNADSLCGLRRLLEQASPNIPRRRVGLRVNPELGLGYRQEARLTYSGSGPISKFGVLPEQIPDALSLARSFGAAITTLHWHVGCGWLGDQLSEVEAVLKRGSELAALFPDLERVNLGGGLGVPLCEADVPVDLAAWNRLVERYFGGRWKVMIEPGAYLVQNASLLLCEAATVEPKRGTWYIGLNVGFNLLIEPVFYGMPSEIVPLRAFDSARPTVRCRFVGNINEAHDALPQWPEIPLPAEGDFFALLSAGAYGTSMASSHCLRGEFREVIVD